MNRMNRRQRRAARQSPSKVLRHPLLGHEIPPPAIDTPATATGSLPRDLYERRFGCKWADFHAPHRDLEDEAPNPALAARFLTHFRGEAGAVPQQVHNLFNWALDLNHQRVGAGVPPLPDNAWGFARLPQEVPIANGMLDAALLVPAPFFDGPVAVRHPTYGTTHALTAEQATVFYGALVYNTLHRIDPPLPTRRDAAAAFGLTQGPQAYAAFYNLFNAVAQRLAEADPSWWEVGRALD